MEVSFVGGIFSSCAVGDHESSGHKTFLVLRILPILSRHMVPYWAHVFFFIFICV